MGRRECASALVYVDKENEGRMLALEEKINGLLLRHGIRVSCSPSRYQGRKGLKRYALAIEVDGDTFGRGAGRKPLKCGMGMEEAMEMEAQGSDKETIAGQMGVSLATYYRKRKKYLEELTGKG